MSRSHISLIEHQENRSRGYDSGSVVGKQLFTVFTDGKKRSQLSMYVEEMIGFGVYGCVYRVRVDYPNHKSRYFAQKVFKQFAFRGGDEDANTQLKNHVEKTVEKHNKLKEIGMPVRDMLRMSEDRKSIIMSLGSNSDTLLVTTNSSQDKCIIDDLGEGDIVIDYKDIAQQLVDIYGIAYNNNVGLELDTFFLSYHKPTQKSTIIIGDYDRVDMNGMSSGALKHNINKYVSSLEYKYKDKDIVRRKEVKELMDQLR